MTIISSEAELAQLSNKTSSNLNSTSLDAQSSSPPLSVWSTIPLIPLMPQATSSASRVMHTASKTSNNPNPSSPPSSAYHPQTTLIAVRTTGSTCSSNITGLPAVLTAS